MTSDRFGLTNLDFQVPRVAPVKSPAEYAKEALVSRIRRFQAGLSPNEEMGVYISGSLAYRVTEIGFAGGSMVVFYGEDQDGRRVETYQHHSQINLTLMALAKPENIEEARRVGFDTALLPEG